MSDALGFRIETPTVTEPPAEAWRKALLDAAYELERDGWGQGFGSEKRGGKKCAALAIYSDLSVPGMDALDKFVAYINGTDAFDLFTWNDTPGRTAAEVCAALRSCAAQP